MKHSIEDIIKEIRAALVAAEGGKKTGKISAVVNISQGTIGKASIIKENAL